MCKKVQDIKKLDITFLFKKPAKSLIIHHQYNCTHYQNSEHSLVLNNTTQLYSQTELKPVSPRGAPGKLLS